MPNCAENAGCKGYIGQFPPSRLAELPGRVKTVRQDGENCHPYFVPCRQMTVWNDVFRLAGLGGRSETGLRAPRHTPRSASASGGITEGMSRSRSPERSGLRRAPRTRRDGSAGEPFLPSARVPFRARSGVHVPFDDADDVVLYDPRRHLASGNRLPGYGLFTDGITYRSHFFIRRATLEIICTGFPWSV
jgi:hypothetical protein